MTRAKAIKVVAPLMMTFLLLPSQVLTQQLDSARGFERQASQQVFDARENYAVIVGVDRYDIATPLNYAVADAKRLAGVFREQGYEVELLLDYEATPTRILRRLSTYGEAATNGGTREQGNLVFAFSGHGFRQGGTNYLATVETDPEDVQGTALSLQAVQKTLRKTGVRQRVLFIDACRNDPAKSSGYDNGAFVLDEDAEGEAILYSTRSGTLSWEDSSLGHGVFTHYLVKGLEGEAAGEDGLVSFRDLEQYVVGEVKRHVLRRFKKTQIPYIGGERTGEFVVARYSERGPTVNPLVQERALGLSRSERTDVQCRLNNAGYAVGAIDGIWGAQTRGALEQWQRDTDLPMTGYLDEGSYEMLVAELVLPEPDPELPKPARRSFEPEMVRIGGECLSRAVGIATTMTSGR